jgi:hypothetical protein
MRYPHGATPNFGLEKVYSSYVGSQCIPAKCAKMDARCANCERQLAFLPSCASLYCEEPDDAPAVARCFAGAFGREPKGEPR